jgi:tetratricopeptide (TPR) repeat protein
MASRRPRAQLPNSLYNEVNGAYNRGDVLRATSLYQQAITLQPDSVAARTNLTVALAHDGRYQEAIAQYQEALKTGPKNSLVRLNLALTWYKQAESEKASAERGGRWRIRGNGDWQCLFYESTALIAERWARATAPYYLERT